LPAVRESEQPSLISKYATEGGAAGDPKIREAVSYGLFSQEKAGVAAAALESIVRDVCTIGQIPFVESRHHVLEEWKLVVGRGQQDQFLSMLLANPAGSQKRKRMAQDLANCILRKTKSPLGAGSADDKAEFETSAPAS
jgi:hypothetical protein